MGEYLRVVVERQYLECVGDKCNGKGAGRGVKTDVDVISACVVLLLARGRVMVTTCTTLTRVVSTMHSYIYCIYCGEKGMIHRCLNPHWNELGERGFDKGQAPRCLEGGQWEVGLLMGR